MPETLKVLIQIVVAILQFAVLGIAIVGAIVVFRRQQDPSRRARLLKRIGMGIMGGFGLFFGLFVVGETLADPGG